MAAAAALFAALLQAPALAALTPFVIRDIRVEGLQRIEIGTVFGYLPVRIGERLTESTSAEAVRILYATGFFQDVRLEDEGGVLVVRVVERPAIASVDLSGSREFDAETLKRALRDVGLAEARIFDRSLLDRAEQEIRRQYLSRSRYSVQIKSTITPLPRNRVGIAMTIEEGISARIVRIRVLGNKAFAESALLDQIDLTTPTWLSWYTRTDQYSREKLSGDLERLRSFYLNRGYLEFGIESTQVSIDPEREGVYVTIRINEGPQYKVRQIRMAGNLLGRERPFRSLLKVQPGDTYSGERMSESTRAITDALGNLGYAFATVSPVPVIDRERRTVDFTVNVDPGRRVYVRRIAIAGNQRTRDEVIRREVRQFEGGWFDSNRIRLSRERIERLGYFSSVNIATEPVPGVPDQIDLKISVVEQSTGNFLAGVGFSSTDRFLVTASINEPNFLGTGNSVGLEVNTGQLQRTASLSINQPYVTDDGISRSIDLYSRTYLAAALGLGDYSLRTSGVGLRFGIPYTELDRIIVGAAWERNDIISGSQALPQRYQEHVAEYGTNSSAFLALLGWTRDSRDSALTPTRGRLQQFNLEATFPGQRLQYAKATYNFQSYVPLNKDYTVAFNATVGFGKGLQSGRPFPVFKRFYAGGIGSVRGFYPSSLGPRDAVDGLPLGGQAMVGGSIEFLAPLTGTGNDKTIRWFLFADAGNVYDTSISLANLRYSAGIGVNWFSPIGPLKLSFGVPVKKEPEDRIQRVQFQIGTSF